MPPQKAERTLLPFYVQTSERWSWDQAAESYMQLYNKAVSM